VVDVIMTQYMQKRSYCRGFRHRLAPRLCRAHCTVLLTARWRVVELATLKNSTISSKHGKGPFQRREATFSRPPTCFTRHSLQTYISGAYAALPRTLASRVFSLPTFTLICLGLASAFLARVIFSTPLS